MYVSYFPPHYSGASKQGIALAKALAKLGHTIEFLTILRDGDKSQDYYDGFKVYRIKNGTGRYQELMFLLNFLVFLWRNHRCFDILHSHGAYYYNSFVGGLSYLFNKKSIAKVTMLNNDLAGLGSGISGKVQAFFMRRFDAYIAISKEIKLELEKLNFDPQKIFLLPNAVDTQRFKPLSHSHEKMMKRQQLGFDAKKCIGLCIGSFFDERKNIVWLIEQWIKYQGFGTDALLVCIGPIKRNQDDNNIFFDLNNSINKASGLVSVIGHTDTIENYYQIADFFILPSKNEGMPNVVLEAISSGLPCVTTPVSGVSALVKENINGFLFFPNNTQSLANALKSLMVADLVAFGQSSRAIATENFSMDSLALSYDNLYHNLTQKND